MTITLIVQKQEYTLDPGFTISEAIHAIGLYPGSYLALRNGEIISVSEIL